MSNFGYNEFNEHFLGTEYLDIPLIRNILISFIVIE